MSAWHVLAALARCQRKLRLLRVRWPATPDPVLRRVAAQHVFWPRAM